MIDNMLHFLSPLSLLFISHPSHSLLELVISHVMRIRIIFSLSEMQFQTFLELSYNL